MTHRQHPAHGAARVLVAHASRHGSTAEIAERIADRLTDAGVDAAALLDAPRPTPGR